jgi:hypothetical protein
VVGLCIWEGTDAGGVENKSEDARHGVRRGSIRRRSVPPTALNA